MFIHNVWHPIKNYKVIHSNQHCITTERTTYPKKPARSHMNMQELATCAERARCRVRAAHVVFRAVGAQGQREEAEAVVRLQF